MGHLNAGRALEQYRNGEFASTTAVVPETLVPIIGWDYGRTPGTTTSDRQVYNLDTPLEAGGFFSITLAWDREVEFANDANSNGAFDVGDTFDDAVDDFVNPLNDDEINTLVLYLVPDGATNISQAVAISEATEGTLQHIFFQVEQTGLYDIWVEQFDDEASVGLDYGIAWWGWDGTPPVVDGGPGDFDGNGSVGPEDFDAFVANFGASVTPGTGADGNGDGVISAADYTIFRDNFVSSSSSTFAIAVPEPATAAMLLTILGFAATRWRAA